MSEFWLAAAIGAGSGLALLALFARLSAQVLATQGLLALAAMLAIYVGARLVSGTLIEVVYEGLFALVIVGAAQIAMRFWLPSIGVAILLHGSYDAFVGPHTGVPDWYPPFCAGFDLVVGLGLLIILWRRKEAG